MISSRPTLVAITLALGFFFLLLWFYTGNIYHTQFFENGSVVVGYQFARLLFIPYLIWLQYALGNIILRRGHFILCFLTGTSILHLVLFILGLRGYYTYPVMVCIAVGLMLASIPQMARVIEGIRKPLLTSEEKIFSVLITLAALAFLFIKGTYPSGGHDFYNMYFPYYQAVLRDGNLGPNEVWYQYFYHKGLGLYFFSMILLDPLAIHLVTAGFVCVAAFMVYDLLRGSTPTRLLPMFAVFLYFAFYIYTPAQGLFKFAGGWGDLEKSHELIAALMLGILWLVTKYMREKDELAAAVLPLVCIASVMIVFHSGFLIGLFLMLTWIYAKRIQPESCRGLFFAALATAAGMAAMLWVNYSHTGMLLDQWAVQLWEYIDWQKIVRWGTSLELYILWNGFMSQPKAPFDFATTIFMAYMSLRLFLWWPLLVLGTLLALHNRQKLPIISRLILIFIFATLMLMVVAARTEPLSFFRFSSFTYAPVLLFTLLLWSLASERAVRTAMVFYLFMLTATALANLNMQSGKDWKDMARAAWRLNTGTYSLYDATNDLRGRSKDLASPIPLRGTHPAFAEIYKILPYKTRIWNMDNMAYCMLPACKVELQSAMVTSPRWYDLAGASIEDGKKILQEEKLNYIFFSRDVVDIPYADAKDVLAALYKGLAPEHIQKTYGIAWTNGRDYLITWKSKDTKPLDAGFMESWKRYHAESVEFRESYFSVVALAPYIKQAAAAKNLKHPLAIK